MTSYIDSQELREKKSVALLQDGVVLKALDEEIIKILDDIEHPKKDPRSKRKITIQYIVDSTPSREIIDLKVQVKTELAPISVMNMSLELRHTIDDDGHLLSYQLKEQSEQADGQCTIDGEEEQRDVVSLPYKDNAVDAEFTEKGEQDEV